MQTDNKRIAKNTFFLYVRMFVSMIISLYTSRMILSALGIVDYGIYNLLGSIVALMGFISGPLASTSSRYISYYLGNGDKDNLSATFSNLLAVHVLYAVIAIVIMEIIGLYLLYYELNIPLSRFKIAAVILQISIVTTAITIVCIPFHSEVIAHECMNVFAFLSISDVVFKLLIVFLLVNLSYDKLLSFSILVFIVSIINETFYVLYSYFHFFEARSMPKIKKGYFFDMLSYNGLMTLESIIIVSCTQGLNILLNMFFTASVNAARGIAVQVQGAVQAFSSNVQMAFKPQIVKSYAQNDITRMHDLLCNCSKFCFFLIYLLSLPLFFEIQFVLNLWLVEVPDHTSNFVRLTLLFVLNYTITQPLVASLQATGIVNRFVIAEGACLALIFPLSYVLLKFLLMPAETVFVVFVGVDILTQIVRLRIILPIIRMKLISYVKRVLLPILAVILSSLPIPLCLRTLMIDDIWTNSLIVIIVCVLSVCLCVFLFGCNKNEKEYARQLIVKYLWKKY